jgi:hypothetical protein
MCTNDSWCSRESISLFDWTLWAGPCCLDVFFIQKSLLYSTILTQARRRDNTLSTISYSVFGKACNLLHDLSFAHRINDTANIIVIFTLHTPTCCKALTSGSSVCREWSIAVFCMFDDLASLERNSGLVPKAVCKGFVSWLAIISILKESVLWMSFKLPVRTTKLTARRLHLMRFYARLRKYSFGACAWYAGTRWCLGGVARHFHQLLWEGTHSYTAFFVVFEKLNRCINICNSIKLIIINKINVKSKKKITIIKQEKQKLQLLLRAVLYFSFLSLATFYQK